jgi:anti-anti-sigma regulatory factor
MAHSIDDLLVRQVSALVSETADAVCIDMEQVPSMESHFYDVLALHCAGKQRLAAAGFASVATARTQTGLVYW